LTQQCNKVALYPVLFRYQTTTTNEGILMRTPILSASRIWHAAKLAIMLGFLQLLTLGAANAQEFIWAPDFTVGTAIPNIEAQDQDGVVQSFDDLKGDKGLLLMLSRSFDW